MKGRSGAPKLGRPRKADEVRQVYSVRLPPKVVEEAQRHAEGLTDAVEKALNLWVSQPFWTVAEEVAYGQWRRHAAAQWWPSKNEARGQLDKLMHAHPRTTFCLIDSGALVP